MDKLIISGQGFPGANEYLQFSEASSHDQINAIVKALGNNVIFDGVVDDEGNTSAGWIIYNNEILPFEASTTGEIVVIVETVTQAAYDINQTGNFNQILPVWKKRYAKFGDLGEANVVASFSFNILKRLRTQETLDGLLQQATEEILGLSEIATQDEANSIDNDTHVITAKKLNNRVATTERRGVLQLASLPEVAEGEDQNKALTIKLLRDVGYRITKITTGAIFMENQVNSYTNYSTDFTKNYGNIYPPEGFSIADFVGVSLSFNYAAYMAGSNVNGDDKQWLNHSVENDRVIIIGNLSENALNTKLNYTAIWQK